MRDFDFLAELFYWSANSKVSYIIDSKQLDHEAVLHFVYLKRMLKKFAVAGQRFVFIPSTSTILCIQHLRWNYRKHRNRTCKIEIWIFSACYDRRRCSQVCSGFDIVISGSGIRTNCDVFREPRCIMSVEEIGKRRRWYSNNMTISRFAVLFTTGAFIYMPREFSSRPIYKRCRSFLDETYCCAREYPAI